MIDINKKYRTRDGRKVTILATWLNNAKPVAAIVPALNGIETVEHFSEDGIWCNDMPEGSLDLIEVSPYDHIKKGDVVLVWQNGWTSKFIRTFHSIAVNSVRVFEGIEANGDTNFSYYENCELYQPKE